MVTEVNTNCQQVHVGTSAALGKFGDRLNGTLVCEGPKYGERVPGFPWSAP